jgi:hypothetical protein
LPRLFPRGTNADICHKASSAFRNQPVNDITKTGTAANGLLTSGASNLQPNRRRRVRELLHRSKLADEHAVVSFAIRTAMRTKNLLAFCKGRLGRSGLLLT